MNVIIIGGTSGIGKGLWEHYANGNNKVAIIGRRSELLTTLFKIKPNNTLIYNFDITQLDCIENNLSSIFSDLGKVDLVILSAGTGDINSTLDFSKERNTINTNILGWTACADIVYNKLQAQGYGHLVTITSVGGLKAEASAPAYSATKAYQINYTKALQGKSKGTHILVSEVRPGLTDTQMAKGDGLFWVMPVKKVTNQIVSGISKRKSTIIVSKRWKLISFILKLFYLIK